MLFDDKEKCLNLAYKILSRYEGVLGKGCTLKILQLSENITYLASCQYDGERRQKAILRLSRPGYHTPEELRAEIEWMRTLGGNPALSLRQPLADDEGKFLCVVQDENRQSYYGAVFTYMSGVPLEEIPLQRQVPWFERLGEITALLHRQSGEWSGARNLKRVRWNYETMVGRQALWGDWRRAAIAENMTIVSEKNESVILRQADSLIRSRLQEYGIHEDNYGLIHADLRGANLLAENDTLKIIDFDDCGFGWYMQDAAASVSFIETEQIMPELIQAWIAGYQRKRAFCRKDIGMIDTFIMMRRLQLLAWIGSRANASSSVAFRDGFAQGTAALAEKYVSGRLDFT